jgi:hypothetical protein
MRPTSGTLLREHAHFAVECLVDHQHVLVGDGRGVGVELPQVQVVVDAIDQRRVKHGASGRGVAGK